MTAPTAPRTVACIEDDASIRIVLRAALEAVGGFRVTLYPSGPAAVEGLAVAPADIILLDVMMPGMDGRATCRALRELPSCDRSVLIFITARARPEDREELLELGAADVLPKPFDPMALAGQIAAIWARCRGAAPSS